MRKHKDVIGGLFWLGVGILLSLWATRYSIGSLTLPGPGSLPLVLGLILILLSIILIARGILSSRVMGRDSPPLLLTGWKKGVYTVVILLLGAFFFERLGYLLTFFLLIVFLMRGAGAQSWKRTVLVAICSALGVYLVFVRLLEQPLPLGLLGI
jgi:putative tricarboxylic transport membrane protein